MTPNGIEFSFLFLCCFCLQEVARWKDARISDFDGMLVSLCKLLQCILFKAALFCFAIASLVHVRLSNKCTDNSRPKHPC